MRSITGILVCHHEKLVYPPRMDYHVCYTCGRKQLRDPDTGYGFGKFSHDFNELLRAAKKPGFQPVAGGAEVSPSRMRRQGLYAGHEPRTVLVFRNGQQREVRDYAIKGNTIVVFTKRHIVRVPITDLDVPSTQAANAQRGVQFRLSA